MRVWPFQVRIEMSTRQEGQGASPRCLLIWGVWPFHYTGHPFMSDRNEHQDSLHGRALSPGPARLCAGRRSGVRGPQHVRGADCASGVAQLPTVSCQLLHQRSGLEASSPLRETQRQLQSRNRRQVMTFLFSPRSVGLVPVFSASARHTVLCGATREPLTHWSLAMRHTS